MESSIKNFDLLFSTNILAEMSEDEKRYYETEDGWLYAEKIYNEINQIGYIVGARNVGKTYGFLDFSIEKGLGGIGERYDFSTMESFRKLPTTLISDFQFLFLRRHGTQAESSMDDLVGVILSKMCQPFLDSIDQKIIEEYEITIEYEGTAKKPRKMFLHFRNFENKKDKKRILIGRLGAIRMVEKFRGPGIEEVKIIIVDEFQSKENWDYLPNEPSKLMDIYESVGRVRCGTGDIKVVCLGNAGTILNPHFDYFGYDEFEQMVTIKKDGQVIFYHLPNKPPRQNDNLQKLIKGSEYGNYSLDNSYADNQIFNVIKLKQAPSPRKCLYSIFLGDAKIGVWNTGDGKTILSRLCDPDKPTFVDRVPMTDEHLDQQVYMVLSSKIQNKMLYFDSPELRLIAEKHLRKYLFRKKEEWEVF